MREARLCGDNDTVVWDRKGKEGWSVRQAESNVKAEGESVSCLYHWSFSQSPVLNLNFPPFQPLLPFSPILPLLQNCFIYRTEKSGVGSALWLYVEVRVSLQA